MPSQSGAKRINVTLDAPQARRLAELAAEAHMSEGTLARSILITAIDRVPRDVNNVIDLLNRIPGAWDRMQRGIDDMEAGRSRSLDEL